MITAKQFETHLQQRCGTIRTSFGVAAGLARGIVQRKLGALAPVPFYPTEPDLLSLNVA